MTVERKQVVCRCFSGFITQNTGPCPKGEKERLSRNVIGYVRIQQKFGINQCTNRCAWTEPRGCGLLDIKSGNLASKREFNECRRGSGGAATPSAFDLDTISTPKLWPILISFRDPNSRSLGKP